MRGAHDHVRFVIGVLRPRQSTRGRVLKPSNPRLQPLNHDVDHGQMNIGFAALDRHFEVLV